MTLPTWLLPILRHPTTWVVVAALVVLARVEYFKWGKEACEARWADANAQAGEMVAKAKYDDLTAQLEFERATRVAAERARDVEIEQKEREKAAKWAARRKLADAKNIPEARDFLAQPWPAGATEWLCADTASAGGADRAHPVCGASDPFGAADADL